MDNPYVGPRTFAREERSRFFGRDREARELLTLTLSEQLVVFYAQSGAGKSSLINTCLIPDLEKKGFKVLPLARVGGDSPLGLDIKNIYVYNLVRMLSPVEMTSDSLAGLGLTEFFTQEKKDASPASPSGTADSPSERQILIIDQFEEIFTTHHDRWQDRGDFFTQLADAMEENPNLWVMLVMREDYIAALDPYAHLLPGHARIRYYMQRLGIDAAIKAIKGPVEKIRPFETGVAEQLARDLCSIKVQGPTDKAESRPGQYVEPVQLQVVCFNLWNKLGPGETITSNDLQSVGDVNASLAGYYDEVVKSVAERTGFRERKIRQWVGTKLIAPGGIRNLVLQDASETSANLANRVIQSLTGIVRAEMRGASVFYELTHDRLVEPIITSNRKWFDAHLSPLQKQAALWNEQKRNSTWLLTDDALKKVDEWASRHTDELTDVEKQYLEECHNLQAQIDQKRAAEQQQLEMAQNLAAEKARSARRAMWGNVIAGILLVIAVIAAIFSWRSAKQAATAEGVAREAEKKARSSQLATIALDRSSSQLDLAILLGLEANATSNTFETRKALLTLIQKANQYRGTLTPPGKNIQSLEFNPNGKTIAMLDEKGVTLWDLEGNPVAGPFFGNPSPVFATAFSPDGKVMATSGKDGSIILWDTATWTKLTSPPLTEHTEWVNSLVFSADGKTLVSAADDAKIIFWNVANPAAPRIIHIIETGTSGINYATFDKKETILAATDCCGTIYWWDIKDPFNPTPVHVGESLNPTTIVQIAFQPDGRYLATADLNGNVTLWDVAEPSQSYPVGLTDDSSGIYSLTMSPDGKTLATGDDGGGITLWDIAIPKRGQLLSKLPQEHSGAVNNISFSPDGKLLASAGADGKMILWDITTTTGQALDSELSDAAASPVNSATFNPAGDLIATGINNGSILLWDVSDKKKAVRMDEDLQGNGSKIEYMEFSANGSLLTLFSSARNLDQPDDEFIGIYDGTTGSFVDKGHVLSKGPDGKFLLYRAYDATDSNVSEKILDEDTGIFPGKAVPGTILFITPDKRIIVNEVTNPDGSPSFQLWDQTTGQPIGDPIQGGFLALSSDGKSLAYQNISEDGNAQIVFEDVKASSKTRTATKLPDYINTISDPTGSVLILLGQVDGDNGRSKIYRYDVSTGRSLDENPSEISGYASGILLVSANSNILLYSGADENDAPTVTAWDVVGKTKIGIPVHGVLSNSKEVSNNIVYDVYEPQIGESTINIINTGTRQSTKSLQGTYLNLVRNGELLIYQYNGSINFFDIKSGQNVAKSIDGKYLGASQNGELLATQNDTNDILIWDLTRTWSLGEPVYQKLDTVQSAALAPTGNKLAVITAKGILVQSTASEVFSDTYFNDHFGNGFSGNTPTLSPDGKMLAIGNDQNTSTTLWDLVTHRQIGAPLPGGTPKFSPDGKILVIGNYGIDTTTLWDIAAMTQIGEKIPGNYSVFSPDGTILAVADYYTSSTILWDMNKQIQIGKEFPGSSPAFSPDGKTLVIGNSSAYTTTLWDWKTHTQIGSPLPGDSPRFSPDGKMLAVGNGTYTTLWNINTITQIGGELPSGFSVFSPDGKTLAIADYNTSKTVLWDLDKQTQIGKEFTGASVGFSPDGKIVAIGNYASGKTTLWDIATQTQIGTEFPGYSPNFSPDGKVLVVGDYNTYTTTLWDLSTRTQIGEAIPGTNGTIDSNGTTLTIGDANSYNTTIWNIDYKKSILQPTKGNLILPDHLVLSSDGKYLASQAADGIVVRDLDTGTTMPLDPGENTEQFTGVMSFYSNNERFSALGENGTIMTWDVSTGKSLSANEKRISSSPIDIAIFSPDGNFLVYGYADSINVWDVLNGKPYTETGATLSLAHSVESITFSPDGKIIAYNDGQDIMLYKFPELSKMRGISANSNKIRNIGLVMDNVDVRYIITLDDAGNTQIWDWATGTKIADPMPGNLQFIGSSTPDRTVYYLDPSGKLISFRWDLSHEEWKKLLCPRAKRNFSQEEWERYFPDKNYPGEQELLTCPDYPPGQ